MNDADCIIKALQELGYTAEVHNKAKNLEGWHGEKRQQTANIIVNRQQVHSAANDVGFLLKADGTYEMIISNFDRHAIHGKKFTQDLLQLYSKHKTRKQAIQMGYMVQSESIDNEGRMKIRITTG